MATETVVETGPVVAAFDRARWGALFAGFFVGMGVLFLLLSLGAAIGFTSVDPRDLGSWKALGIGFGIWGGISAIIASFCGAVIAGRLCTSADRSGGMVHGIALWGFTWAVGLWLGMMALGTAVSGAGKAVGAAAGAAGGAASNINMSSIGNQAADQANAWLREHGKPAVPPQQMQAAMKDITGQAAAAARQGKNPADAINQQTIVTSLQRNTNLSRADAQQLAAQVQQQLRNAVQQASQAAGNVGEAAAGVSKAGAWGAFIAAVLTLIASAWGGIVGVTSRTRLLGPSRERVARPLAPQHA